MLDIDQPTDPDFISLISLSITPAPNLHPAREKRCSVSEVQGRLHRYSKNELIAPEDSLPITVWKSPYQGCIL